MEVRKNAFASVSKYDGAATKVEPSRQFAVGLFNWWKLDRSLRYIVSVIRVVESFFKIGFQSIRLLHFLRVQFGMQRLIWVCRTDSQLSKGSHRVVVRQAEVPKSTKILNSLKCDSFDTKHKLVKQVGAKLVNGRNTSNLQFWFWSAVDDGPNEDVGGLNKKPYTPTRTYEKTLNLSGQWTQLVQFIVNAKLRYRMKQFPTWKFWIAQFKLSPVYH